MKSIPKRTRVWEINKSRVEEKEEGEKGMKLLTGGRGGGKTIEMFTIERVDLPIKMQDYTNKILRDKILPEMEEELMSFLKANGYRPKQTESYCKYLKKKLDKEGKEIDLRIINVVNEEGSTSNYYEYRFINKEEKV